MRQTFLMVDEINEFESAVGEKRKETNGKDEGSGRWATESGI